ncbi:MAG TPA: mechanosensitive ion channel domain-containing protein [Vicinamibacterales bacterium]
MTSAIRPVMTALAVLLAVAQAAAAPSLAVDPLGRQTPAGTVMGFLAATARGDWPRASRYLDSKLPQTRVEELARELKVLLDRGLTVDLDRLSRKPEGEQDQRFGKDHELVGSIESQSGKRDVLLVRVQYGDQPPIWLFSPETLHDVPAVHQEYEPSFLEEYLPRAFIQGYGVQYRLWSWVVMLAAGVAAFIITAFLARLLTFLVRIVLRRLSGDLAPASVRSLLRPAHWLILGATLRGMSDYLLTLRQRYVGGRLATLVIIASITWLGVTILATTVGRWARTLERQGTTERIALVRLMGRLLQTTAVVLGILALLQAIGINLTPVLAGLGVGGIAVALASQKTLENLFGGMIVIGDSPIRIGHFCRVGTMTGTVEDIGLRSTRIRTLARTVISIPNADLASQSIENFAARDKLLFNHTFTLRYETTAEQLRLVLANVGTLLCQHEKIESSSVRVRLLRFAPSGFEVELFAYVNVTDFEGFLEAQEDLLLRLMDTIEASGSALAFPSQTMYFTRDAGMGRRAPAEANEPAPGTGNRRA